MWMIRRTDGLFWSNDWGWTKFEDATSFDDDDKEQCALPAGGHWYSMNRARRKAA